jgi:hypothetical protein
MSQERWATLAGQLRAVAIVDHEPDPRACWVEVAPVD